MRHFIQISPADIGRTNSYQAIYLFIWGINTVHMDHIGVSEVKERIRSDALHDLLANLVTEITRFLQISPSDVNKKIATTQLFLFGASIPFMLTILELLRSRNGSEVTPEMIF